MIRLTLILLFASLACYAQQHRVINAAIKSSKYTPRSFHLAAVEDARADTSAMGMSYSERNKSTSILKLQNGLGHFMEYYLHACADHSDSPGIVLHVDELKMTEETATGRDDLHLKITLSFYSGGNKLMEYGGEANKTLSTRSDTAITGMIGGYTDDCMKKFDEWWAKNKKSMQPPGSIKVNVSLAQLETGDRYIFYSPTKKLTVGDFKGPPDETADVLADTYSSISMRYSSVTEDGEVIVDVVVGCYFDRSKSWMKSAGRNDSVLAHEQLHFDIRAIGACRLVNSLKNTHFTITGYADELKAIQKKIADDTEDMQALYDLEAAHGLNREKQAEWTSKIRLQLSSTHCFKD